ncbi:MAG: hypothetical protein ACRDKE_04780 [Solirubrobacterales bacterium]
MPPTSMTAAAPTLDAQAQDESLSHSQTPGKSTSSFRLYFFTFLSVLACALALANVASAATPAGEDQYIEQSPNGGGNSGSDEDVVPVDANNDGVISEAEVKQAAEKNEKKAKKAEAKDDDGSTGATGAAATTTPTPPAAQSVATAAKIGPLSQKTALMLAGLVLLVGGGAVFFGGAGGGLFGLGSGASGGTPPASS